MKFRAARLMFSFSGGLFSVLAGCSYTEGVVWRLRPISEELTGMTSDLLELREEVYSDLKRMASKRLSRNPLRNQISSTSLVHESLLKYKNREQLRDLEQRKQFFGTFAYIMRSVLVDLARRKDCEKRHLLYLSATVDLHEYSSMDDEEYLALDNAISKLSALDPEVGRVVHFRLFACLSIAAIAETLEISTRTADRYWAYGKSWLKLELGDVDV